MKKIFFWLIIATPAVSHAGDPSVERLTLPPGFEISLFCAQVPGARSLALGTDGTIFVSTRERGVVYAVRDTDADNRADQVVTIARGLDMPNGIAFRKGDLYVAEVSRILRFDRIEDRLDNPPAPVVVNDRLPADRHHGWKFIAFGPDGRLYVPVGAPCNVCERSDPRYAAIMRMAQDGTGLEVYARGIRNTVGFDWHPVTGDLWFTDNGRDWLGDDRPPDELNRSDRPGQHFGFPYCHGEDILDPQFGFDGACTLYVKPERELGAHVAALGMRFYTGSMFPPEYRNQIFIAEHGSWNRSEPVGYRITLVRLAEDRVLSYEVFAEGWLQKDAVSGRPVDLVVMPDGSLIVSDDYAGVLYRINYRRAED